VTFGGGITTENGSPGADGSGLKAPFSSQAFCQRFSVPTGSYVLGSPEASDNFVVFLHALSQKKKVFNLIYSFQTKVLHHSCFS